ncbi:hypothetical protein E2C01_007945 [Portunus trituberculatus]|uniref:Uncharacterized protein n=1 Tax=Portunus trituberculatus TaxID=210409 RepID=A0A5B7D0B0_PORTR|nr:hypothetical protein [Portunus trituberculatus]
MAEKPRSAAWQGVQTARRECQGCAWTVGVTEADPCLVMLPGGGGGGGGGGRAGVGGVAMLEGL